MLEELLQQASLTVHTCANLLRKLATNPWTNSVDLTVVFPAGETEVSFLHGLGRTMNGAMIVGMSNTLLVDPTVSLPRANAQTHVTIMAQVGPISDTTVKLRVY
jgi:hypothetical protein